jgi:predicted acyl esterase
LEWTTAPLEHDVHIIGPIELQLDAACTAPDTAFIAYLQDVHDDGNTNVTAGFLRTGLRKVDEEQSKQSAPVLPCDNFEAVPIGQKVTYRIPLVPNARRFKIGHKIRLYLTTDDQNKDVPAPLEFRHASVGTSSFNMVFSSSRLLLPVAK